MEQLTYEEELNVISELLDNPKDNYFLDNGTSRAVFQYGEGRVVKVAIDEGGLLQNKQEIEGYKMAPELCAEIYAYGRNIIVMEEVDICDCSYDVISDLLCSSSDEDYIKVDQECYQEINDCYDLDDAEDRAVLFNKACEVFGSTNDNAQMGYRFSDRSLCLYDYGFRGNVDYCQVGNMDNYVYDDSPEQVLRDAYCAVFKAL